MLWSLIKILIFVAFAAALTWGAGLLMETPGEVKIALGAQEYTLTPIGFLVAFLLAMVCFWLILKVVGMIVAVLRFLSGDKTAITRYFDRNRERKGFDALTNSLFALASGDNRAAQSQALQAEKLLNRPDLTRLVNAQAANASGNFERAAMYYKEMLSDDRSRFVGVQGLLEQKLGAGDTETALKLAEKAFALKPRHHGVLNTLFDLQSKKKNWAGARYTLKAKVSAAALPKDVGRRREAVLLLADARDAIVDDNMARARDAGYQANRLAPDLIPAAVLAADLHTKNGEARAAARIIRRAWSAKPHPDLAAAFAAIVPEETPSERLKRFKPLLQQKQNDAEVALVAAELALAAEDFPEARRSLGHLAETDPTTRSLAIMAAIEKGEGSPDSVVRGWLAKALSAARGEAWLCNSCNHVHGQWQPMCESCGAFDTLSWDRQPHAEDAFGASASMLPLIVTGSQIASSFDEPEPIVPTEEAPVTDAEEVPEQETQPGAA